MNELTEEEKEERRTQEFKADIRKIDSEIKTLMIKLETLQIKRNNIIDNYLK